MSEMIYGIHAVQEILEHEPKRFLKVFISRERKDKRILHLIHIFRDYGVIVQLVDRQRLNKKSNSAVHQGIIAYVKAGRRYQEGDLLKLIEKLDNPFLLILDEVTDPHNLGACLRSANAAGVHAVIIPRYRSVKLNATVKKWPVVRQRAFL